MAVKLTRPNPVMNFVIVTLAFLPYSLSLPVVTQLEDGDVELRVIWLVAADGDFRGLGPSDSQM